MAAWVTDRKVNYINSAQLCLPRGILQLQATADSHLEGGHHPPHSDQAPLTYFTLFTHEQRGRQDHTLKTTPGDPMTLCDNSSVSSHRETCLLPRPLPCYPGLSGSESSPGGNSLPDPGNLWNPLTVCSLVAWWDRQERLVSSFKC